MKRSAKILCFAIWIISCLFLTETGKAATDTTFVLSLQVNMTKAVRSGLFYPSLDGLYVTFDTLIADQQLVPAGGNIYTLLIADGVDSGVIYHFHFRINGSINETVDRQILIGQGINSYSCWWNNDYLNSTSFQVDMRYMVQQRIFRPDSDFVDVVGNMNNWTGSPHMTRIDTGYVYQTTYNLEPSTTAVFKFRINGDSNKIELNGKPDRLLLIPDTVIQPRYWFNNYNPGKVTMSFYCNMKYMTRAGHFNRQSDYVDVAGNFNGNGAYDILYDTDRDSIYTATLMIDTAFYHQNPVTFKYRINGNWAMAELQGQPPRSYVLHDTLGGRNIDSSWFNNWNPEVPTPPMAVHVSIQGKYIFKEYLSGAYSYEDINGIREGATSFQWYRSADSLGINITVIDTATQIAYQVDSLSIHKWLVFEVTPRADSGSAKAGQPVRVVTKTPIGALGVSETGNIISLVYPNPFLDSFLIDSREALSRVELYDLVGKIVFRQTAPESKEIIVRPGNLSPGIYILRAYSRDNQSGQAKILKQ
jgi:hypothetical protein